MAGCRFLVVRPTFDNYLIRSRRGLYSWKKSDDDIRYEGRTVPAKDLFACDGNHRHKYIELPLLHVLPRIALPAFSLPNSIFIFFRSWPRIRYDSDWSVLRFLPFEYQKVDSLVSFLETLLHHVVWYIQTANEETSSLGTPKLSDSTGQCSPCLLLYTTLSYARSLHPPVVKHFLWLASLFALCIPASKTGFSVASSFAI